MNGKTVKLVVLGVFVLVLTGFQSLSARPPYQEEFTEKFDFAPGGSFSLTNVSGTIEITGTDEERCEISAIKIATRAKNRDQAEKMLKRVTIEVKRDERTIEVTAKYPRGRKSFSWGDREGDSSESLIENLSDTWDKLVDALSGDLEFDFGTGTPVEVNYRIKLPRRTTVEVSNVHGQVEVLEIAEDLEASLVNGDLYLTRLDGDIEAKLVNGSMRITRARGSIEAKIVNGTIDAGLADFAGNRGAEFGAVNGDITIRLDESAAADLEFFTLSGEIEVELPIEIKGKSARKKVTATLNGGGPPIEVHVINGDIRLKKM